MRRQRLAIGCSVTVLLLILAGWLALTITTRTAPHNTLLDAGREGFVPKDSLGKPDLGPDRARILAQQEVAPGKMLLLYAWPPSTDMPTDHLSVIPIGVQETTIRAFPWQPRLGWHFAGVAGRPATLPRGDDFYAGALPAGFSGVDEPVSTAWGLSKRGAQVRITWSDGVVTLAPLQQETYLVTRPDPNYRTNPALRLHVRKTELLDTDDKILAYHDFPGSVFPEVRGPTPLPGHSTIVYDIAQHRYTPIHSQGSTRYFWVKKAANAAFSSAKTGQIRYHWAISPSYGRDDHVLHGG